jgi:hypothetical protein
MGSLDRVVVSLREGETSKLGLQERPSCLGVSARLGVVVFMVLFPRCSIAWHDATLPVVTALLAWWWFANCLARQELVVASIIISCSPDGVVAIVRK